MVEKPGAQNRACENQGNQCELSDHWKLKKCFFKKQWITVDNAKKTKRLTEIQVLTKSFTERVFKKKAKVAQLFKPINDWDIPTNTRSN